MDNYIDLSYVLRSLQKGAGYLYSMQRENGSWQDFELEVGVSDEWVTGFVGAKFANVLHMIGINPYYYDFIKKAHKFLLSKYRNGWGYSSTVLRDADSTANISVFFNLLNDNSFQIEITDFLKMHEKAVGGFSTYCVKIVQEAVGSEIPNFYIPWLDSHPTVTCNCLIALKKLNSSMDFINSFDYLKSIVESDESCYWWKGKNYLRALLVEVFETKDIKEKILERVLVEYKDKYTEYIGYTDNANTFEMALAIKIMILCNYDIEIIQKNISNLICLQRADGSWKPSAAMNTPSKETGFMGRDEFMKTSASLDKNALFTTSQCIEVLALYINLIGGL